MNKEFLECDSPNYYIVEYEIYDDISVFRCPAENLLLEMAGLSLTASLTNILNVLQTKDYDVETANKLLSYWALARRENIQNIIEKSTSLKNCEDRLKAAGIVIRELSAQESYITDNDGVIYKMQYGFHRKVNAELRSWARNILGVLPFEPTLLLSFNPVTISHEKLLRWTREHSLEEQIRIIFLLKELKCSFQDYIMNDAYNLNVHETPIMIG